MTLKRDNHKWACTILGCGLGEVAIGTSEDDKVLRHGQEDHVRNDPVKLKCRCCARPRVVQTRDATLPSATPLPPPATPSDTGSFHFERDPETDFGVIFESDVPNDFSSSFDYYY
jgi:hypothetical protein